MSRRNLSLDSTPPTPPPLELPTSRESTDSEDANAVYRQILVAQGKISHQLEQIANTMGLMSRTLNQRMNAETFLIYRKIDRLATALDLQEVQGPVPSSSKKSPLLLQPSRSKSVIRK
jgi:hypothetical protein